MSVAEMLQIKPLTLVSTDWETEVQKSEITWLEAQ